MQGAALESAHMTPFTWMLDVQQSEPMDTTEIWGREVRQKTGGCSWEVC